MLPNALRNWFSRAWIALQNPTMAAIRVSVRAYQEGFAVGEILIPLGPHRDLTALSSEILGLQPWEFDRIVIESSRPLPMPVLILGEDSGGRRMLFGGAALADRMKPRKWAMLFYNDVEFGRAYNPGRDIALEAYSGPNVDVLMLEDDTSRATTLYYVNPNRSPATVGSPRESNMGDSRTLYDFIMTAKTEFPAERYVLALYDHGFGWQGCCVDQTSNDMLTMDEIREAISAAGGVDVTLFTAPCLMGELESVYELRDWTDVYVGSQDLSAYIAWVGTIQRIRSTLEADPRIRTEDLARAVVNSIAEHIPANLRRFGFDYGDRLTMSAIDVRAAPRLVSDLDALSGALLGQPSEAADILEAVWRGIQHFNNYFSVDLRDLLEKYDSRETRPPIKALIRRALESLDACVLAEYHGPGNPGSRGLSVYFPLPPEAEMNRDYADAALGLDFPAHTRWDELVVACRRLLPSAAPRPSADRVR
jgi:hypothetical protein